MKETDILSLGRLDICFRFVISKNIKIIHRLQKGNIVKTHTSGCKKASACVIVYKSDFGILAFMYTLWYDVLIKDGRPRRTDEPERKEEDYDIF